jgi:hypothetical protein
MLSIILSIASIAASGVPPYFITTKSPYLAFGGIAQRHYYRRMLVQVFEDLEQRKLRSEFIRTKGERHIKRQASKREFTK